MSRDSDDIGNLYVYVYLIGFAITVPTSASKVECCNMHCSYSSLLTTPDVYIVVVELSVALSSHDRLIGSLPAKCWPEAFHATFIHNIQRNGEDRIGWGEA